MGAIDSILEQILDQARWAPSGDNTQPWRFEILDARQIVVHGSDTRDHCVYDLDGHPSQLSLGALLESLALASSSHGLRMGASRRAGLPESTPTFDVTFTPAPALAADPLAGYLALRSVQRRPMSTRPLSSAEKAALAAAMPAPYQVHWLEGPGQRWASARLMFANAKLRLTMPEAYLVHRAVIEWNARFSQDRIPDQALGVDALTARLMHWIMRRWSRVAFFNRYLAGTWAPRLQMELLPALACGAHFVLLAERPAQSVDDYVAAGRAMQRFWLCATQLGLQLQPEVTPLIFARYVRECRPFSATPGMQQRAAALAARSAALIGPERLARAVFMGRIGAGPAAVARSLRRPLAQLIIAPRS